MLVEIPKSAEEEIVALVTMALQETLDAQRASDPFFEENGWSFEVTTSPFPE